MRNIDEYTKEYKEDNFEDILVAYRRKKVLEIVSRYPHKKILEIGCGMEPLFQFIAEDEYDTYTLVEPSIIFYENALGLLEDERKEKIVCINDFFGSEIVSKLEKYDFIVCSSLLHEIEDTRAFLKAIKNVCEQNAVCHINVPNANSFHRILAKEMGVIRDVHQMSNRNIVYQQQKVYDLELLCKEIEDCGFKTIEKGSYFVKPFTHDQMLLMIQNDILDEKILGGLYRMEKYMPDLGAEIYVNIKEK